MAQQKVYLKFIIGRSCFYLLLTSFFFSAPADFSPTSDTVTFEPALTPMPECRRIMIINDLVLEVEEEFTISLATNDTRVSFNLDDNLAVVFISDNDAGV